MVEATDITFIKQAAEATVKLDNRAAWAKLEEICRRGFPAAEVKEIKTSAWSVRRQLLRGVPLDQVEIAAPAKPAVPEPAPSPPAALPLPDSEAAEQIVSYAADDAAELHRQFLPTTIPPAPKPAQRPMIGFRPDMPRWGLRPL